MNVLITGAAGFLGSHLTDRFLADGHRVVGVDNFLTGSRANIQHLSNEPRFDFVELDVSTRLDVGGSFDGVLHFASPASPVDYLALPLETLDVGSAGTRHALELARRDSSRFLVASTSEVYGDPVVHPQPESYWGNVNPIGPRSVYDEAKRFAEALTMAYRRTHNVNTAIVRIFNTYGPRMRPEDGRVVSNFIVQALRGQALTVYGTGTQTRSFCYVSDEIEGIYRLFLSDDPGPMNIGNPAGYTVRELAARVMALVDPTLSIVTRSLPQDDPKQRQPDISRAREILGWEPRISIDEGLRATVDHFRGVLDRVSQPARAS
jgi:dTDP-glucose 4,6-dehydratase